MQEYIDLIRNDSKRNYKNMMHKAAGQLRYPFIVPGSQSYNHVLWDWDSWLTDVAVRQIRADNGDLSEDYTECERGCILNFLDHMDSEGRIPIAITENDSIPKPEEKDVNIHKPCLAQHMAFIVRENSGDSGWVESCFPRLEAFIGYYREQCFHKETGLYYWKNDVAIGVDNDPCTFYRPGCSSASVYLNCLMYKELKAMEFICGCIGRDGGTYREQAESLKNAVNTCLWDERNGFYYSADLNLLPIDPDAYYHSGMPRHWHCVLQKIDVWSGFLAMWSGIAGKERAERMVYENMCVDRLFNGRYGIRTLAKTEPMYRIAASHNPSCWLGPVWGVSNYMCFKGLVDYGFSGEAGELAEKTISLLGKSIADCGEMYEYYDPDSGEGIINPGFQNWNLLVNNMIAWYNGEPRVEEF